MNRDDIEKYLRMLGQELQKKQVIGEILLAKYTKQQKLEARVQYIVEKLFDL